MHVRLGGYHVGDVEFVAAFDVDAAKVGPRPRQGDLLRSEQHHPLRPGRRDRRHRAAGPDDGRPRQVLPPDHRGVTGGGGRRGRGAATQRGRRARLLPAGRFRAGPEALRPVRHRRQGGLRQRHPGVHRQRPGVGRRSSPMPACRSSATTSRARSGRPSCTASWPACSRTAAWCSTAPTSSTSAATWTSRTCSSGSAWSPRRSPRPSRSPARSTTASPPTTCTSARRTTCRGWRTASGPTSAWRAATSATSRSTSSSSSRSGTRPTPPASSSTPCAAPSWPRTGASAARCIGPSSYFMKSPPEQFHDDVAHQMVEDFAAGRS